MIKVTHKGDFSNIERFFNKVLKHDYLNIIADYCERGLEALKDATPADSGETAEAWAYEIEQSNGHITITFTNSHEESGCNVVILLIYGHGTRNGGYVEGNDFVTPTLKPIFQELADQLWREVTE